MEHEKKRKACAAYFAARPVYQKLFRKVRDKYRSLGRFGGTFVLTRLTLEEKAQLGGFFQKDYTENKSVSISAPLMEKALASSRFAGLSWTEILEEYFGCPLLVKKELERQKTEARENYFAEFLGQCECREGKKWLEQVLVQKQGVYGFLMQQYRENQEELCGILNLVMRGISSLPALEMKRRQEEKEKNEENCQQGISLELLPVFAARVTGNPHYFDEGTIGERLLGAFMKDYFQEETGLSGAEYKARLLYNAGILKDEVSNDVLVYGIHGETVYGDIHQGIEGFCRNKEPVKLTLWNLGKLGKVTGQREHVSENKAENKIENKDKIPVYIVENPAVFSVLVKKYPNRTIVCGNGQLRLAVLVLMDKLAQSSVFYYAGDFDPEGLLIAQRLKIRYGDKLKLWNYRVSWYEKYASEETLSEKRIKKLDKLHIEELSELKEAMCRKRRPAYQEAMLQVEGYL